MEIRWEEPPVKVLTEGKDYTLLFVATLRKNPGKWALYREGVKQRSMKMNLSRRFGDIEWRSQLCEDNTYTLWGRARKED